VLLKYCLRDELTSHVEGTCRRDQGHQRTSKQESTTRRTRHRVSSQTCTIVSLTCTSRRSPNHVSPMPRYIPIELYVPIFQYITSIAELSNLCTVSRAFRDEAQRILYHTVRLPNDRDRIISWCHTIVENAGLAMQVYSLSLPIAFAHKPVLMVAPDFMPVLQELQHAVKRALSSLSRLVKLYTYSSLGTDYLDPDIFCGHPFHLQVFGEDLPMSRFEQWLKFLSEQPGIRHWRSNVHEGHALNPNVLPLLTSADVYLITINILAPCPMIRALRVRRWSSRSDELLRLELFRHTLTSFSVADIDRPQAVQIVRDAVSNIKFLGLQPSFGVSMLVEPFLEFY
jgi:hypothetical protein